MPKFCLVARADCSLQSAPDYLEGEAANSPGGDMNLEDLKQKVLKYLEE